MNLFSVLDGSFYRGDKAILKGISMEIMPGEILCVLGCNGVGKTTFLKCCMGFLQWNRGESRLLGERVANSREFWKKVSYVPQARNVNMGLSVLDMVVLGLNPFLAFHPKKEHYHEAMETLERLGIANLSNQHCYHLSGGEMQMVLFARALISKPVLLVLDEPESNLDIKNQHIILDLLASLSKQGVGVLLNTHYPAHAHKISHKCLLFYRENDSPKYIYGRTQEVLTKRHLGRIFDVPHYLFNDIFAF
ncbi:ABC transporter ATP-binding protein [Helicobacter sp. 11S02596-1]|uniref:ABC transporter ATP-binding protein n=1 Tax=Helicobacter sp. 11S02596-1 TaxID=1476194 RepID=UPI000BA7E081|nr:ABC transporter ATP-binding protein [Helicobacter sp. 11S02596-1]PAF42378.1 hypothetical protein BJI48_07145 [Helicobacter sp. 11S02596-1]